MTFIGLLFEAREELSKSQPDLSKVRRLVNEALDDSTGKLIMPNHDYPDLIRSD